MNQDEETRYIKMITAAFHQEWPVFTRRFERRMRGYEYLRSQQYTPEQIAYYAGQKRPVNVFNVVFDKFNHILGDQLLSDQAQRVIPLSGGNPQLAATWEKILDHWHNQNDYRAEMGRTCLAGWNGGGVILPRWSNERQIDGSLVYMNEDEFCVMWDSRAKNYFCDDAQYMMRWRWMTPGQIMAVKKWERHKAKLKEIMDTTREADVLHGEGAEWMVRNMSDPKFSDKAKGQYMVLEFHEIVHETAEIVLDRATGEANVLAIKDERRKRAYLKANPNLKVVDGQAKIKYVTTIIPGLNYFLEREKADTQDGMYDIILYHPYPYGRYTHEFFGIMDPLTGPQDYVNDLQNRFLDITNKSANSGVEIVDEAYDNPEAVDSAGEAGITYHKRGKYAPMNTLRRLEGPTVHAGFEQLVHDAIFFVDLLSTSENQMGRMESRNEPASLFAQRVAQAQIRFSVPMFWLNSVKKRLNNKMIRMTQSNLNTEKLLLIADWKTGQSEQLFVNIRQGDDILNNLQTGEYEVAIDEVSKSPLIKVLQDQQRLQFTQILMKVFGPNAYRVIDWKALLEGAGLGQTEDQLALIMKFIGQLAQAQAMTGALGQTNALLDTVKKNVDLESQASDGDDAEEKNPRKTSRKAET